MYEILFGIITVTTICGTYIYKKGCEITGYGKHEYKYTVDSKRELKGKDIEIYLTNAGIGIFIAYGYYIFSEVINNYYMKYIISKEKIIEMAAKKLIKKKKVKDQEIYIHREVQEKIIQEYLNQDLETYLIIFGEKGKKNKRN
jgi:uncharacterized membrane protein